MVVVADLRRRGLDTWCPGLDRVKVRRCRKVHFLSRSRNACVGQKYGCHRFSNMNVDVSSFSERESQTMLWAMLNTFSWSSWGMKIRCLMFKTFWNRSSEVYNSDDNQLSNVGISCWNVELFWDLRNYTKSVRWMEKNGRKRRNGTSVTRRKGDLENLSKIAVPTVQNLVGRTVVPKLRGTIEKKRYFY